MRAVNGYILTSRTLANSPIWKKPPLYLKVWMYLLLKASYSDNGNLKRGQVRTSIPEIQEACSYYVGYRKETPSYKEVRSVIDYLRNPDEGQPKGNMIVTTKVTHGFIATICNYDLYQDFGNYEGQDEGRTKDARREKQGQNKKNTNNTKTKKDIYSSLHSEYISKESFDALERALSDFEQMRKSIKKPMTDRARTLLVSNLKKLAGGDVNKMVAILEQSILNSWAGVYALKEDKDVRSDFRANGGNRGGMAGGASGSGGDSQVGRVTFPRRANSLQEED